MIDKYIQLLDFISSSWEPFSVIHKQKKWVHVQDMRYILQMLSLGYEEFVNKIYQTA